MPTSSRQVNVVAVASLVLGTSVSGLAQLVALVATLVVMPLAERPGSS
jgi:hypothetical protein